MSEQAKSKPKRRYARELKTTTAKAATAKRQKTAPPPRGTKIAHVIALLEREEGATLDELTTATSWQPHSIRAALTGLKKKGHVIEKSKRDDITCYGITKSA